MESMIFIDTHVAVWLFYGEKDEFSSLARKSIESNALFVSPMVALELNYLKEIGRIEHDSEAVLPALKAQFGVEVFESNFMDIIQEAGTFKWTRDPFDRIISAHAFLEGMKLLTRDKNIRAQFELAFW